MKKLLYFIIFILMAAALRYAVLLFMLGMLPTFTAHYVDRSKERNLTKIVFSCNLSGVLPYLSKLWKNGISADSVQQLLADPHVWLVMYFAAAMGYVLVWFFPQMVHFVLETKQRATITALQHKQQVIIDEWGMQVETAAEKFLRNAAYEEAKKKSK